MEKYGGRGAATSDRAFWLQAYDGGSYTIDRVRAASCGSQTCRFPCSEASNRNALRSWTT